jgi:hypothetical protein
MGAAATARDTAMTISHDTPVDTKIAVLDGL